jgi:hypothetical protein
MSTNSQDQEISLNQVFKSLVNLVNKVGDTIFEFLLFIKKNLVIFIVLLIIGIVSGYFLDKSTKSYENFLMVSPNFGSTDYLYAKVALLNAKKTENDTAFFKQLGITDASKLGKIEVKAILDVYKLIQSNESNFELIKLLSENGNIENIVKEDLTSKNYPVHVIELHASEKISNEGTIKPLLRFLNASTYFNSIQKKYIESTKTKIISNDSTISQINNLIKDYSLGSKNKPSEKLMYYNNESNQINDILKTKDQMINEQARHKMDLINNDVIIKEVNTALNLKSSKGLNGKLKFIFPILLITLFLVFSVFINFYKKQVLKRNLV